jgi:hypothetical protein
MDARDDLNSLHSHDLVPTFHCIACKASAPAISGIFGSLTFQPEMGNATATPIVGGSSRWKKRRCKARQGFRRFRELRVVMRGCECVAGDGLAHGSGPASRWVARTAAFAAAYYATCELRRCGHAQRPSLPLAHDASRVYVFSPQRQRHSHCHSAICCGKMLSGAHTHLQNHNERLRTGCTGH